MKNIDDSELTAKTISEMSGHMATGSAWMVFMRWSIRGIGLISTLVLVRVLGPKDFGVIAIATIVTGFFEVFTETGQRLAIIRHPNPSKEYIDSAWTAQLIVCLILAVGAFLSAPLAEFYFGDPNATTIVRVLSLRLVLMGFENIGTVAFRRDLEFRTEFRYGVYQRLASAVITITLALTLRNYWALAFGIVAGQLVSLIIGYAMHPYRPSISFRHTREIWGFSNWILAGQASVYVNARIDQIALGGVPNAAHRIGAYSVGVDIATMPTAELVIPASRALYPVFTRLAGNPTALREAYLSSLAAASIVCWSAGIGLAVVSRDFATVVLGPQWTEVTPILPWIAISAAMFALSSSVLTVHQATGHARTFAMQSWQRVALTVPLVLVAARSENLERLAQARFLATILFVPILFNSLKPLIGTTARDIFDVTLRPCLAAIAMAVFVLICEQSMLTLAPVVRLLLMIALGSCAYLIALVTLWHLFGRPPTIEKTILSIASRYFGLRH